MLRNCCLKVRGFATHLIFTKKEKKEKTIHQHTLPEWSDEWRDSARKLKTLSSSSREHNAQSVCSRVRRALDAYDADDERKREREKKVHPRGS